MASLFRALTLSRSAVHRADKSFRFSAVVKTLVQNGDAEGVEENTALLGLPVWLKNCYKKCCPRGFAKMPQNSNVWRHNPPRPFIPLPGQDWSLLHPSSSKLNFFRPFRGVLRFCDWVTEPEESLQLLLIGFRECRWSILAVIDQHWSVPVVTALSGSAVWPPQWEMGI